MDPAAQEAAIADLCALAARGETVDAIMAAAREKARDCRVIAEQAARVQRRHAALVGGAETRGFAERQLLHWAEFLASSARPVEDVGALPDHRSGERSIYVSWQFPTWPRFLAPVGRRGWLVLVAEDRRWIDRAAGAGATFNFRDARLSSRLVRALAEGRTVYAMMDFCYPETTHVMAPFLGLPARTPSGLLELARRFRYTIRVASARDDVPVVLDAIDPVEPVEAAAQRINAAIGAEIEADPPAWLNWAMAEHRFTIDFWPERRGMREETGRALEPRRAVRKEDG